ncbi:MAG: hypothetical protein HY609_00155 [Deltaproteobacteria bacterium]|nr:hypothetical protein [Deltaproteobacteria bacterium]MBI4223318.1 hypothetical protein [Deltaproteobacteria bacterium]
MKKLLVILFFFLVLSPWSVVRSPVFAQTPQVPHLLNFQSVLTDAAGIPLPNGMYDVTFSIVDAEGQELYAETQTLEAAQGVVSAMIGAQGSLDLSQLDPQTPRFLHVQVAGQGPARQMEIVTVPYSLYSQQALGAAPRSIDGEAIRPGAITAEHLAEDVLGDVRNNLFYSQGGDLPTVLRDLDVAIQQRQVNLDSTRVQLQSQINTVNASVSANQSAADSRLAIAEQNVDTLMNPPRVAAAGIVYVPNTWTAELEWGYNVSSVSPNVQINFQDAIETPYVVMLTPVTMTDGGGETADPSAGSMTSSSFNVLTGTENPARFHFVVFK